MKSILSQIGVLARVVATVEAKGCHVISAEAASYEEPRMHVRFEDFTRLFFGKAVQRKPDGGEHVHWYGVIDGVRIVAVETIAPEKELVTL